MIVIASYLLASRTLDVATLVDDLGEFLKTLGSGEVTVLYTNSDRGDPNVSGAPTPPGFQREIGVKTQGSS